MQRLKKTVIAIALAFPAVAIAQSAQELKAELDALKSKVKQLETMVDKVNEKSAKSVITDGFDGETRAEFNRVKIKAEAMDDQLEASGFKGLKISGFMDPTYIYNQRQQTNSFVFMKNFGDMNNNGSAPGSTAVYGYDNAFFGTALVRFEKEMEGGSKWLLELMPHKSYGDATGFNAGSLVNQAYVTLPSRVGKDKFYAGQVGSWMGYEYELPTAKKTITNNLLFDFTEPAAFMTGFGYEHYEGVAWDFKAIVGNLNNGRVTDRRTPALHWRADYIPGEYWGVGASGVHGKTSGTTSVNYVDIDAFFIRGDWSFLGQVEGGLAKGHAFDGRDSRWAGLSGLAAYKFTPQFEGIARVDYIKNDKNGGGTPNLLSSGTCASASGPTACGDYRNGFGPGIDNATGLINDPDKGANRYALTLGLDYAVTANAMLKLELRHDRATQDVFYDVKSQSYKNSNTLIGVSTVVSF